MFTTYGSANYTCKAFLIVRYDQEVVDTSGGYNYIKVTRTATKSYSWLHMTPQAAATCKAAMDAKYTRSFAEWTYDADATPRITETNVTERKSDVASVVTACGSRDVNVTVNETDVKYVRQTAEVYADPASLFETENDRDYDENTRPQTTEGLSRYGSHNCVVSQELDVKYVSRKTKNYLGTKLYEYTRYATKTYSYVGMTEAAARACVADMLAQYTRAYYYIDSSKFSVSNFGKSRRLTGATVAASYNGHTWTVTVSVNETDVRASATVAALATLFAAENARNYNDYRLVLTGVQRRLTIGTVSYTQALPGFNWENLRLEYLWGGNEEWQSVQFSTPTRVTLPNEDVAIECRLVYGSIVSNTITA